MERNVYLDGIMGLVTADAVGVPAEFKTREQLAREPVTDMRAFGTHNVPAGTWSDDSSMALASLDSLSEGFDPEDMMLNFVDWLEKGEYTPFGQVFDAGCTCTAAIEKYESTGNINTCGRDRENDNGNGSLMRILPVCIYFSLAEKNRECSKSEAVEAVHTASALTHAHQRSLIACGLYHFLVREIISGSGDFCGRLQAGFDKGFEFYGKNKNFADELEFYERMKSLDSFAALPENKISSSGYVVDTFEAAVWCAVNTNTYEECVLRAVNLGRDTDTVAAVAGGLAGLYYGCENIPAKWLEKIARREWITELCNAMQCAKDSENNE